MRIEGKEYTLKFGLNSARLYCIARNIELWEYEKEVAKMNFKKPTIQTLEILGLLVLTAIQSYDEEVDLKIGNIIDCFNEEFIAEVFEEFNQSMPQKSEKKKVKAKK